MALQWTAVNDSLTMSRVHKGYDYRVRKSERGGYLAIQEYRDRGEVQRRELCPTEATAIELCETWAEQSLPRFN